MKEHYFHDTYVCEMTLKETKFIVEDLLSWGQLCEDNVIYIEYKNGKTLFLDSSTSC